MTTHKKAAHHHKPKTAEPSAPAAAMSTPEYQDAMLVKMDEVLIDLDEMNALLQQLLDHLRGSPPP